MVFGSLPKGEMEDKAVIEIICDKIDDCNLTARHAKDYARQAKFWVLR